MELNLGFGVSPTSKASRRRRWSVERDVRKDIPFHCLPKTYIYYYLVIAPKNHSRRTLFRIKKNHPCFFIERSYIS